MSQLQPSTQSNRSEANRAETNRAETNRAETNRAETNRAETNQAETNRAKTNQAETKQAETKQAETNQAETKQAETKQAETKQAETKQAETKQAETKQAENNQAETKRDAPSTQRQNALGNDSTPAPEQDRGATQTDAIEVSKQAERTSLETRNADDGQSEAFSTIDGSGNNVFNPNLGISDDNFIRLFGKDPSRDPDVNNLPNPRDISNIVSNQNGRDIPNSRGRSDYLWLFGQFVDHDFAASPADRGNRAPIPVPENDPEFGNRGVEELDFTRSQTKGGEQFSENSHFLDLGQVYGQNDEQLNKLRSFEGGKLRVGEDGLLPRDENGDMLAGDGRATENPALTSMHIVWLREHNRLAEQVSQANPQLSDEQVFQEARKQNIAQYQSVVYNEFLPALIGQNTLPEYAGYNPTVDPRLSNSFSTAAYRLGHTLVSENLLRLDANGNEYSGGHVSLRDSFSNSSSLEESGIDPFLRGLGAQRAQEVDPQIVDSLRSFLIPGPRERATDLASLNIQRGRDHQLPSYNDVRRQLGLRALGEGAEQELQAGAGDRLRQAYQNPEQVDLWTGGLSERPIADSLLGPTFTTIVADQFARLRDGDRFHYENQYSGDELARLKNTSLADVIERNSGVNFATDNVFQAAS